MTNSLSVVLNIFPPVYLNISSSFFDIFFFDISGESTESITESIESMGESTDVVEKNSNLFLTTKKHTSWDTSLSKISESVIDNTSHLCLICILSNSNVGDDNIDGDIMKANTPLSKNFNECSINKP